MKSGEQTAEVKVLARKIAQENDTTRFVELAVLMHRLLDELLGDHHRLLPVRFCVFFRFLHLF